jgi:hypothetical protein
LKVPDTPGRDGKKIIEATVEKKGNNKAYTYTYKVE